jgi:rhodanese-related sulfurtransferase
MIKHLSVDEAHRDMEDGSIYVDVRSIPEFEQGHPEGAVNVPLLHLDPRTRQMQPNQDFVTVMRANFASDAPLLIGCQSGVRSVQAAQVLASAGFTNVSNVAGGFAGSHAGDRGWAQAGLPIETTAASGRDYATLQSKAAGR